MLSVEEALTRILALTKTLEPESVGLLEADGQTLAENIFAQFNLPSADNSAMDGYCVRSEDVRVASSDSGITLKVIGQIQAGELPSGKVTSRSMSSTESAGSTTLICT